MEEEAFLFLFSSTASFQILTIDLARVPISLREEKREMKKGVLKESAWGARVKMVARGERERRGEEGRKRESSRGSVVSELAYGDSSSSFLSEVQKKRWIRSALCLSEVETRRYDEIEEARGRRKSDRWSREGVEGGGGRKKRTLRTSSVGLTRSLRLWRAFTAS